MAHNVEFGRCPVCRTVLSTVSDEAIAEARCPRCEAGLWLLNFSVGPCFFVRRPGQTPAQFLALLAGEGLGASAEDIAEFLRDADSLEKVEFLLELELAMGLPDGAQDP